MQNKPCCRTSHISIFLTDPLLVFQYNIGILLIFSHAGTFNAREKASCLFKFVREQLQSDWLPFILSEPGGGSLTQEESCFEELGLVSSVQKYLPKVKTFSTLSNTLVSRYTCIQS